MKRLTVNGVLDEKKFDEFLEAAFKLGKEKPSLFWWCPICDDLVPAQTIGEDSEKGWFIECAGDHEPRRFWAREMKRGFACVKERP